jgi:uncharacterized protein (TIGR03083 family)
LVIGHDGGMQESSSLGLAQTPRLTPPDFLSRFDTAARQFAELVAAGDLDAPVPPCPGWTLTDLVAHLGEVHQWATHILVTGNPDAEDTPAPSTRSALVQWYNDSAGALLSTLRETDPLAPAWTFGPEPKTASFWFRRQAHETTIHLWDAAASQNTDKPIDNTLALDGIAELTSVFFPRQVRMGRIQPLEHSLALEAGSTDPTRWVLAGDGTGPASAADAPAQATITGPAEPLLLLLWGRIGLDDPQLSVSGDEAAARAVLNSGLTP